MKKYKKEIERLKKVVSKARIGEDDLTNNSSSYSFTTERVNFFFLGDADVLFFKDSIELLWNCNKEIAETYSQSNLQKKIIDLLAMSLSTNKDISESQLIPIFNQILEVPILEYHFFYQFFGGELKAPFVEFGDFVIYNKKDSFELITRLYPQAKNDAIFQMMLPQPIIGIKVKARDEKRAGELADDLCNSFQNVFSYVIGDLNHFHRVGILSFRPESHVKKVLFTRNLAGFNIISDNRIDVKLDDIRFSSSIEGNDKIWSLITKKDKNPLEDRLLLAIEWIGKACYEKDPPKAIIQFVFAIEGMLQDNEREFVTPSISNQIGEWVAFILGNSKSERMELLRNFKELYGLRSGIAHGGRKKIRISDLELAQKISKLLVIKFLTVEPYCEITSISQLKDHVQNLKFT